jgi:glycosyltransferase involved in cell wall biosynthesis
MLARLAAVRGEPRVTVLIGCWNNADTLERAARSILDQTLRELELIVVDDGSTDDTPAVVESLGDERARRLALSHMGISRSLNEGLRAARAPFVAIQDADDWSEPERLERQVAVLDRRPEVAVVGCRMHEVDELERPLEPRTSFAPGDVNGVLMRFNPIPNSCACFRRDAVLAAGAYDPRYRYAMDYDLLLRLAERHVLVTLDEPLATRRMSSRNVAARKERAQIRESVAMRLRAMRRRRSPRGGTGILIGAVAWIAPLPLKRALRRARGQAP